MSTADPISGVVVRVSLPAGLERIRERHDVAAAAGAPAHVTLLFPFLPVAGLVADIRRDLATIAAAIGPFEVSFERVGRFPTVVYLSPEPATPFESLTAAIVEAYPDYPPYGGAFEVVVPHLTLVESPTAPLDEIAEAAARHLPFTRRAATVEVLVEDVDERWRSHWRIPLGVGPR